LLDLTKSRDDPDRNIQIADQLSGLPPDADATMMQRRTTPVWSPDSTRVAWMELGYFNGEFNGRIMLYDLTSATISVAADRVSTGYGDAGEWGIPNLAGWGSMIAQISINANIYPNEVDSSFGMLLELVEPDGERIQQPISYFANFEDRLTEHHWLKLDETWRLGLYYPNLGWLALDTTTHSYQLLENPPSIGAITEAGWLGQLVSVEPRQYVWQNADGTRTEVTAGAPFTFSPAGIPFWLEDGQLSTFAENDVTLPQIEGIGITAVVWTPIIWQTDGVGRSVEPISVPE
jgi:hypothetical protein